MVMLHLSPYDSMLPGVALRIAWMDGYMSIAMEDTEEYVDGIFRAKYGDTFIRGNNVLYISPQRKVEPDETEMGSEGPVEPDSPEGQ